MAQVYASDGVTGADLFSAAALKLGDSDLKDTARTALASCVGTDLAGAGGIHTKSPAEGAIALVKELAHVQRVQDVGNSRVLNAMRQLSNRSAGL